MGQAVAAQYVEASVAAGLGPGLGPGHHILDFVVGVFWRTGPELTGSSPAANEATTNCNIYAL